MRAGADLVDVGAVRERVLEQPQLELLRQDPGDRVVDPRQIARTNGGSRAQGRAGQVRSLQYIRQRLTAAGYRITVPPQAFSGPSGARPSRSYAEDRELRRDSLELLDRCVPVDREVRTGSRRKGQVTAQDRRAG